MILMGTVREVNEMSRYIDADALMKTFQRLCSKITCVECPMYNGDGNKCEVQLRMENALTIDAVSIVRCKECKWHDTCCRNIYEDWRDATPTDIEYCSHGEREGE